jgi:DNA mismatch endonuclease (patch repair protein)
MPKYRTAIFVHGCFWHRHPNCKYAYMPKSNIATWEKKFRDNVARDIRNEEALRSSGWNVICVWECETADIPKLTDRLRQALVRGQ